MRSVVSLGNPEPSGVEHADDTPTERRHIREAAVALAELSGQHQLVITYGSAPHLDLLLSWTHTQRCGPHLDVVNAVPEEALDVKSLRRSRSPFSAGVVGAGVGVEARREPLPAGSSRS